MHFQLGQQCFQDEGEARTNFSLPTLATIAAFRRANLLRLQVIAIRSQAGLPALCHAIFSHCCGSCSEQRKLLRSLVENKMPNSHAPFFSSVLETRRLRDEVPDQKMWRWAKSVGEEVEDTVRVLPNLDVCGIAPKGAGTLPL